MASQLNNSGTGEGGARSSQNQADAPMDPKEVKALIEEVEALKKELEAVQAEKAEAEALAKEAAALREEVAGLRTETAALRKEAAARGPGHVAPGFALHQILCGQEVDPLSGWFIPNPVTGDHIFNFGRHRGRTLSEVAKTDLSYFAWMLNGADFPDAVNEVVEEVCSRVPSTRRGSWGSRALLK